MKYNDINTFRAATRLEDDRLSTLMMHVLTVIDSVEKRLEEIEDLLIEMNED